MGDVVVVEAANNVENGIHAADVPEELVAEPLPQARSPDQPGDVDDLDDCRYHLARLDHRVDLLQPRIGDRQDAEVWFDGGERVVGGVGSGCRQSVEEGALADVGKPDDPCL